MSIRMKCDVFPAPQHCRHCHRYCLHRRRRIHKKFFYVSECEFDFILASSHIIKAENAIFLWLHRRRCRSPLNDLLILSVEMTLRLGTIVWVAQCSLASHGTDERCQCVPLHFSFTIYLFNFCVWCESMRMHTWASVCYHTWYIHVTHKLLMINSIVMKINLQNGGTRTPCTNRIAHATLGGLSIVLI